VLRRRAWTAILCLGLGGCEVWHDGIILHEHNNWCGHAYLGSVSLDVCPRDIAGSEAWRGPMGENEIRIKDPGRGGRPVSDRPVPWTVPGGGEADRTRGSRGFDGGPETGAYPIWPLPEPAKERPESE
jgi:hypothetical protein